MDLHRILRAASIITIACEIRREKSRSRSDIYSLQLELISTTIYCHCNIMLLYSNRFNVLSEQSSNSRCRCGVIVAVVLQRCLAAECARCSAASSASVDARYDDVSVPFRVLIGSNGLPNEVWLGRYIEVLAPVSRRQNLIAAVSINEALTVYIHVALRKRLCPMHDRLLLLVGNKGSVAFISRSLITRQRLHIDLRLL